LGIQPEPVRAKSFEEWCKKTAKLIEERRR